MLCTPLVAAVVTLLSSLAAWVLIERKATAPAPGREEAVTPEQPVSG